jgi:hypothetical protein
MKLKHHRLDPHAMVRRALLEHGQKSRGLTEAEWLFVRSVFDLEWEVM